EAAGGAFQAVGGVLPFLVVGGIVETGEINVRLRTKETEQLVFERAVVERVAGEMNVIDGIAVAGGSKARGDIVRRLHACCRDFHAATPSLEQVTAILGTGRYRFVKRRVLQAFPALGRKGGGVVFMVNSV